MSDQNNRRHEEILERLTAGIAELTTSEAWERWLRFQSRFHHYSAQNVLLIQMQRPDATRVAGFHAWLKLGRHVRKGEKGIAILAPVTRRTRDEDEQGGEDVVRKAVVGFRATYVWDVAQTDGDALEEPPVHRLTGADPMGLFEKLSLVAREIGYTVEDEYLSGGVNGDCSVDERRIRIEVRNDPAQQVKTLAHELAHALLHDAEHRTLARPLKELEAESAAFVICSALGVRTDDYSFGYVATWAGGGDQAVAGIKASAGRIQQAAHRVLSRLEEPEKAAADCAA